MNRRVWMQIGLFALLLSFDQLSKWWIEQQIPFFTQTVIEGYFNLVKAHNFGVAFSVFDDWDSPWRTNLLLGVTIGIASVVILWWWRERNNKGIEPWMLVMILAGAVGNIWDRMVLGYVVDFVDWYFISDGVDYHWPAFNLADAYISTAVVILIATSAKRA